MCWESGIAANGLGSHRAARRGNLWTWLEDAGDRLRSLPGYAIAIRASQFLEIFLGMGYRYKLKSSHESLTIVCLYKVYYA